MNANQRQSILDAIVEFEIADFETKNIVLSGMPSSGKSTLAKYLAKELNKELYDSDKEITKVYGKTPAEIIETEGEAKFREVECAVIKDLSLKRGAIIALGGGAILKDVNVKNLKRNGVIIYVKRNLELLVCKNRPLSQKCGIENLYNQRKGIYESTCDYIVENNSDIDTAVREIILKYENSCN